MIIVILGMNTFLPKPFQLEDLIKEYTKHRETVIRGGQAATPATAATDNGNRSNANTQRRRVKDERTSLATVNALEEV
jgi:hypothetical protein